MSFRASFVSFGLRRSLTCLGLPAFFALTACGDDSSRSDKTEEPTPVGAEDNPENAIISVDERAIAGTLSDDVVSIQIPARAKASGRGTLLVSLTDVDDSEVIDEAEVDYEVDDDDELTLKVKLDAPKGIADQADLVGFNLRVQDKPDMPEPELNLTRSLLHVVPPYEVRLEGPKQITLNKPITYRVSARHPVTRDPLEDQEIRIVVLRDGEQVDELTQKTDEVGNAVVSLTLETLGAYQVQATTALSETEEVLEEEVEVQATGQKVLLTTDKPIYKPGQTIHLRALALDRQGNKPVKGEPVVFEIEDSKGNKILKRDLKSDAHGIAATSFQLGRILNEGTFKVRGAVGEQITEKTVTVSQYALPKFKVQITTDKGWYRAGDSVTAKIDARYFFGKPVAGGDVKLELGALVAGEVVFDQVMAKTTADGLYEAELTLPEVLPGVDINSGNALAFLRATVLDPASQEVVQETPITVANTGVKLSLVPEATSLVPGLENRIQLFATDPLGAPIGSAPVTLEVNDQELDGQTDEFGQLELRWVPNASGNVVASVRIEPEGQTPVTQRFDFGSQTGGAEHLIVRTDKSVYELGEELELEVLTTGDGGNVFIDWLNAGQAINMDTLEVDDGEATQKFTIDNTMLGSNRIEAYVVDADGNITRSGRSVFVRNNASLKIEMNADKEVYSPGEPAKLTFSVSDEEGQPQVAALGVQIVDEAVFSLIDARPGLLKTFFELEDSFAEPHYQIGAPGGSLANLLFNATAAEDAAANKAAQRQTEANLAALDGMSVTGIRQGSWPKTLQKAKQVLSPYMSKRKSALLERVGVQAGAVIAKLERDGCSVDQYYCEELDQSYVELFKQRLGDGFEAYDFWGNAFSNNPMQFDEALRLTSAGPDELAGNEDDETISILLSDLEVAINEALGGDDESLDMAGGGPVAFDPMAPAVDEGVADDDSAPDNPVPGEQPNNGAEATPRVRQDFPETLYVNPAIITDSSGEASIEVPLADSITEWRVSSLGHTANGRLGSAVNGVTVFQDFFVDVNFPATLTRGDEIDFPIAVYNYLDEPQTVELSLMADDWFTATGETSLSVELAPGEVKGVSFPVRVETVGLQTLTVQGLGSEKSDAVARTVKVIPDGKAFPVAQSGSLQGTAAHSVSFPAEAVTGSQELYINVYPAFLSQAVSGMDSILATPSGCFEQTTSTTWPNVLVTDYMQQTGQITPEILLKAESLISAGYQRLLTFEHPGGGFSWFGTQDPAPFLSVTAFGLMEFADMAKVHAVDPAMVERTRQWLASKQQADGSWEGDQSEFFSFHTSQVRNTAFVVWALLAADYEGPEVASGLDFVKANLNAESSDAYSLAIIANAMVLANDGAASDVFAQLADAKQTDGDKIFWDTEIQTNFYGGGSDAAVATTALVTHAMLLDGGHADDVAGALNYITAAKDSSGNFGSTQATTWSLKALLLAASKGTEGAVGTFSISVDGEPFTTLDLIETQHDVMTTVDMKNLATTGEHEITLEFEGTGKVSYNLVSSHHLPWAQVPVEMDGPLSVAVAYDREQLQVDETINASVTVQNNTSLPANMVLVTVGLPPGFELLSQDLQPYLDSGVLSRFELTGKQLILYLTELGASATQRFDYGLRATMPINAADGGAEVFPYYEPEQKAQAPAIVLVVN